MWPQHGTSVDYNQYNISLLCSIEILILDLDFNFICIWFQTEFAHSCNSCVALKTRLRMSRNVSVSLFSSSLSCHVSAQCLNHTYKQVDCCLFMYHLCCTAKLWLVSEDIWPLLLRATSLQSTVIRFQTDFKSSFIPSRTRRSVRQASSSVTLEFYFQQHKLSKCVKMNEIMFSFFFHQVIVNYLFHWAAQRLLEYFSVCYSVHKWGLEINQSNVNLTASCNHVICFHHLYITHALLRSRRYVSCGYFISSPDSTTPAQHVWFFQLVIMHMVSALCGCMLGC